MSPSPALDDDNSHHAARGGVDIGGVGLQGRRNGEQNDCDEGSQVAEHVSRSRPVSVLNASRGTRGHEGFARPGSGS